MESIAFGQHFAVMFDVACVGADKADGAGEVVLRTDVIGGCSGKIGGLVGDDDRCTLAGKGARNGGDDAAPVTIQVLVFNRDLVFLSVLAAVTTWGHHAGAFCQQAYLYLSDPRIACRPICLVLYSLVRQTQLVAIKVSHIGREFRRTLIGRAFTGTAQVKGPAVPPFNVFLCPDTKANHRAIPVGCRLFVKGYRDCEGEVRAAPVGHAIQG